MGLCHTDREVESWTEKAARGCRRHLGVRRVRALPGLPVQHAGHLNPAPSPMHTLETRSLSRRGPCGRDAPSCSGRCHRSRSYRR